MLKNKIKEEQLLFIKDFGKKLKSVFGFNAGSEDFFNAIEDMLIEADIGPMLTMEIVDSLKKSLRSSNIKSEADLKNNLKIILKGFLKTIEIIPNPETLNIFLILGVNGVGKTSACAKLANYFIPFFGKEKILLSACDTFRAAAIDQLKFFGDKLGVRVVSQTQGSDPGAVVFDSIESAKAKGERIIIADTAGRLHNKANLVKELEKINKIILNKTTSGNYKKILAVDATTGQNALRQAEIFNEAVGIDSLILTKYDSASKGGTAVSISKALNIPFSFLSSGERLEDISVFDSEQFLDDLLEIK